ncbi:TonB-dependent receptor [Komagataeibacter xylinus]|uniref:TonB-dependent receptor n=1 Tax=Komagataeibacter xylinus TaxID=28448 RepID=UPI00278C0A1F|nr:TonB-dependent receptor [Komagataeibacter xylinus]
MGHFKYPSAKIFNQNCNTNTFTAFVQDTYRPIRNLALYFGFKSVLNTTRVGDGYLNQSYYGNIGNITGGESQTIARPFLPHIGVDWTFLQNHELFIDISENVHTYAKSGFKLSNSPFAVTEDAYNNSRNSIRPETAWTYAIGYRYHDKLLNASVYAYRTNFNNRLQQISSGPGVNPVSTVANVDGVTMNGVYAALTVTPLRNLAITNSISYNHAVYDNNMTDSDGPRLGRFLRRLTLSFNLTNTRYIATMGENGNPMTAPSAYIDQSMLIGTPRMAFGAIKADF